MNGVHDMGGMHGFGAVPIERDEPVFHDDWEGRVYAMSFATFITVFPVDETRAAIERVPPAEYLNSPYYKRWLIGLEMLLLEHSHVTATELAAGASEGMPSAFVNKMTLEQAQAFLYPGVSCASPKPVAPQFSVGDRVRVRNEHPEGYTRVPRYVRDKYGTIIADRGAFMFPDAIGRLEPDRPQHVYHVRFSAQDLWGPQALAHDYLHIDLYDEHLERVSS